MKPLASIFLHVRNNKFIYLLALVCFYPAFFWYNPNTIIAGGDIFQIFNLDKWLPLSQYLWADNEFMGVVGGGVAAAPTIMPHLALNYVIDFFNIGPEWRVILVLVLFNLAAAFSMYFFIGCLSKKMSSGLKFIGAVFYILNNYLLFYLGSYVTGWLFLILPLLLGLLIKITRSDPEKKGLYRILFGLSFILAAPTFGNPPTFALLLVVIFVFSVTLLFFCYSKKGRLQLFYDFLKTFIVTAVINSWWLYAVINFYLSLNQGANAIAAVTDPQAWDWTFRNSGLANILWFQSSWIWNQDNVGYYDFYQTTLIKLLIFLPIVLAFLPFLYRRNRRIKLLLPLLILLLSGVILANRASSPFVDLNNFLLEKVPLMWLFREPVRFIGIVVFAVAALLPFGIEVLMNLLSDPSLLVRCKDSRVRKWLLQHQGISKRFIGVVIFIVIIVISFPLWSSQVVTKFNIIENVNYQTEIPDSLIQAGDYINSGQHKYLSLPATPNYQGTYSWGYHGIDPFVGIVTNPIFRINPDSYLVGSETMNNTLYDWYLSALNHIDPVKIASLSNLGIDRVIWRNDLVNTEEMEQLDAIKMELESFPKREFGEISIYELPKNKEKTEIYTTKCLSLISDYQDVVIDSFSSQPFISTADYQKSFINLDSVAMPDNKKISGDSFVCANLQSCKYSDEEVIINNENVYSDNTLSVTFETKTSGDYEMFITISGEFSGDTKLTATVQDNLYNIELGEGLNENERIPFGKLYLETGQQTITFSVGGGPFKAHIKSLEIINTKNAENDCLAEVSESKKINPVYYEVDLPVTEGPCLIVSDQNFNSGWKLSLNENISEIEHVKINNQSNGWILSHCPGGTAVITYKPQRIFYIFLIISSIAAIILISYAVFKQAKK